MELGTGGDYQAVADTPYLVSYENGRIVGELRVLVGRIYYVWMISRYKVLGVRIKKDRVMWVEYDPARHANTAARYKGG